MLNSVTVLPRMFEEKQEVTTCYRLRKLFSTFTNQGVLCRFSRFDMPSREEVVQLLRVLRQEYAALVKTYAADDVVDFICGHIQFSLRNASLSLV